MEIRGLSGMHQGRSIPVNGSVVFGRNQQSCTVVFPDKTKGISRVHCRVDADGTITDLGSTYGTFVNGRKIPPNIPTKLNPGDTFYVGDQSNMFTVSGSGSQVKTHPSSVKNRKTALAAAIVAAVLVIAVIVVCFAVFINKSFSLEGSTWKVAEAPGIRMSFAENGDLAISFQGEYALEGSFTYSPAGDNMVMIKYTAPQETTSSTSEIGAEIGVDVSVSLFDLLGGGLNGSRSGSQSETQTITREYINGVIWKYKYDRKTDSVKVTDVNDYDLFTLKH